MVTSRDRLFIIEHFGKKHTCYLWHEVCDHCGVDTTSGPQMELNSNIWRTFVDSIPDFICGSDILTIREIYNLSMHESAKYFGITVAEWQDYEDERKHPSPELTRDLKRSLVDVEFFIDIMLACYPLKKT